MSSKTHKSQDCKYQCQSLAIAAKLQSCVKMALQVTVFILNNFNGMHWNAQNGITQILVLICGFFFCLVSDEKIPLGSLSIK